MVDNYCVLVQRPDFSLASELPEVVGEIQWTLKYSGLVAIKQKMVTWYKVKVMGPKCSKS